MAQNQGIPELGGGVTLGYGMAGNDCYPATVVEVKYFRSGPNRGRPSRVTVQHDDCEPVFFEDGEYVFTSNPDNTTRTYFFRKHHGRYVWKEEGSDRPARIQFGDRGYARDAHF